jgi:hypothetical protein
MCPLFVVPVQSLIILTGAAAATIVRGDKQIFLSVAFKTRQQNTLRLASKIVCAGNNCWHFAHIDGCIINIPLARRVFIEALKTASDRAGIVIRSTVLTIHTFSSAALAALLSIHHTMKASGLRHQ